MRLLKKEYLIIRTKQQILVKWICNLFRRIKMDFIQSGKKLSNFTTQDVNISNDK